MKEKGVSDNDIIYIELDKKEFKDIGTPKKLEKVIDGFVNDKAFKYLFIDEVQNVKNFEIPCNETLPFYAYISETPSETDNRR